MLLGFFNIPFMPHNLIPVQGSHFIFLLIFCLDTPKDGSGPTNFGTEPSLVSLLAISFPGTPTCPWTQYSPTICWVEISFTPFGKVVPMETLWQPKGLPKPPGCQSKYSRTSLVYHITKQVDSNSKPSTLYLWGDWLILWLGQ
jgi:hypothetical protein